MGREPQHKKTNHIKQDVEEKKNAVKAREVIKPNQPNNYKTTPPPKRMEARDGL